jgi:outer membrane immunogenic protein
MFSGADMKKLATCLVAVTALTGTYAFAADMGVPPAPAPAPVYNWTGWYVGVNAGASMGKVQSDFNVDDVHVHTSTGNFTVFGFSDRDFVSPSGFIGGGQIGYNWQFSPIWVAGLEADFQGADEKDSATLTHPFDFNAPIGTTNNHVTGSRVLDYSAQIDWFGTVRARLGYVWGNGNVFSYVTGGLAYGEVKTDGTSTFSGSVGTPIGPTNSFSITHAIGHSHVNTGWVLGYGTEGRLATPGWTWRVETYYMDLGHLNDTDSVVPFPTVLSVNGGQVTTNSHFTDWILRGGLSYQFH